VPNSGEDIEETKQPAAGNGGFPGDNGGDPNPNELYTLRAFKSTPMFIDALTELSVKVLTSEGNKK